MDATVAGHSLGRVGVFYPKLARLPHLKTLLGCESLVFRPGNSAAKKLDAVIGWGHKPTARGARRYAQRHGLPYLALEDGFLRSVGLGSQAAPLSLIVDRQGIFYDAGGPSELELLLAADGPDDLLQDQTLLRRARHCRERIVEAQLSKYNHTPAELPALLQEGVPFVLLVDQTFDDASVNLGGAGRERFHQMLKAACQEYPGARLVVKVHPDTVAGTKKGYLAHAELPDEVEVVDEDVNPIALLKRAKHVFTCTSQLGFEALMVGKPVTCFGAPFYAGWGLTDDRVPVERRGVRRSLDQLVAAALLLYPRYVHPLTGELCQAEQVIEHLALQREMFSKNSYDFYCFGFSPWKRPFVRRYLDAPKNRVYFASSKQAALDHGLADPQENLPHVIVRWASKDTEQLPRWAAAKSIPVWNMEDGFLRSVGLGSDLTAPGSLVLDKRGIYYDPSQPSDLEHILQTAEFEAHELASAARLRAHILESKISKYNLDADESLERPEGARRVIFVPGQVEDDASVRLGGRVRSNQELLACVRRTNPEAYIIYKPHPDVLSGNRRGDVVPGGQQTWDELVEHTSIDRCLQVADEVHTITSLVGFEALLRELPVFTYGQPFYAGWGLTNDHEPMLRRTRRLTLDELVAGALVRYPRYYSFRAHAFCSALDMVDELSRARNAQPKRSILGAAPVRKLKSLVVSATEWAREF